MVQVSRAVIVLLLLSLGSVITAQSAQADILGYPNPNATDCSATYGIYSWCVNGSWLSSRGYGYRNCTDYVAWKLQTLGVPDSKTRGLHDGGRWADNAHLNGLAWSTTPLAWDAAVQQSTSSSDYGHVAFVEATNNDGTITVSEYNHHEDGTGDVRTGTPADLGFTKFVDFGVHPTSGGTPPPPPGPFVTANMAGSVKHVFTIDASRTIRETWWDYGEEPQTMSITTVSEGTPIGISSTIVGVWRHVYVAMQEGPIYEIVWQPDETPYTWEIANIPDVVGVSAQYVDGLTEVFAVDTSRNISETWWDYGEEPQTQTITTLIGGTPTGISSIVTSPYRQVYVSTLEGWLTETWWQPNQAATSWLVDTIPNSIGVSAQYNNGLKELFTLTSDGTIKETWWDYGEEPQTQTITQPGFDGRTPTGIGSIVSGAYRHVYTITQQGPAYETWWQPQQASTTWQISSN